MIKQRMKRFRLRAGLAAASALLGLALAIPALAIVVTTVNYLEDTVLDLPGFSSRLLILAGSKTASLTIDSTSFTVTVAAGDAATIRYSGPNPGTLNNPTTTQCRRVGDNNDVIVNGPLTVIFTPTTTLCPAPSSSGGGGGAYYAPYISLSAPNGGQSLVPGSIYTISWSAGGSNLSAIKLSLSTDSGATYSTVIVASTSNTSYYYWTVPDIATTTARVKAEAMSGGTVSSLASATSATDFTIQGTPDTTPPGQATNFVAATGDGQALLTWVAPSNADFHGMKIVRKLGSDPTGPADGTVIYDGTAAFAIDLGLTNGTTYHYGAFAHDAVPNYAAGVFVSAQPVAGQPAPQPPASYSTDLTPEEADAPAADPTATGGYQPAAASQATPTINVDLDIQPRPGVVLVLTPGSLIKGSQPAVYYYGRDGKRYVFPNQATYNSWYADFSTVTTISDGLLASIQLGGNVSYRPGTRMIKITTDPKVYAVSRGGLLRWVTTEAVARLLYGDHWNQMIDDVSDAFFVNYQLGAPIYVCPTNSGLTQDDAACH